jgi:hypothetical protein
VITQCNSVALDAHGAAVRKAYPKASHARTSLDLADSFDLQGCHATVDWNIRAAQTPEQSTAFS